MSKRFETHYRRIAQVFSTNKRERRLFAANEALALGSMAGWTAVSAASGIARSTINRGHAQLKAGSNELGEQVRRRGGGRRGARVAVPALFCGRRFEELIEEREDHAATRSPHADLAGSSRSQRNIATGRCRQPNR